MPKTMEIALNRGLFTVIDVDDYPLVAAYRWYANPSPSGFYVMAAGKTAEGKRTTLYMHRVITGAPKGKEVDHKNRNTLDNRRDNLKVGSHLDNMRNGQQALATHCPKGHPYDEANTLWTKGKRHRQCRECGRAWCAARIATETPKQRAARRAKAKANHERTKEASRARMRAYAKSHRDEARERYRRWYERKKLQRQES